MRHAPRISIQRAALVKGHGAFARRIGLTSGHCPYRTNGPLREAWLEGYREEHRERLMADFFRRRGLSAG